ncbi:class I SAM-dependent methyltransferase [Pygmaiobacter massiliensis]|uniref:class I SAM-dependent methyltransferase n=1 Tax=Pygmaiobacter massiliensis TaxID=1917873 RepID=UPI000C7DAE00|nr:methyltransferase domain-containing protein [Pygmaiobacter massiliensis]
MNRYEQRSRDTYNKMAVEYDTSREGVYTRAFKQKLIETVHIRERDKLLDVACGNGALLAMLSKTVHFDGYGVDIAENMICEARKRLPDMRFSVAGCDNLPFGDGSFNVMTVSAAFHHFPDASKFAEEAFRTLKPGGVLYIADVFWPAPLRVLCNPFLRFAKTGDVKIYAPSEIKTLFEQRGFVCKGLQVQTPMQIITLEKT